MILITGATGSLGSYLVEALLKEGSEPLCLFVRSLNKLSFSYYRDSRVQVLTGNLQNIASWRTALAQARILIHCATAWGGDDTFQVNLKGPLELLNALNPNCEAIFYFSTASILQPDPLEICFDPLALVKGTDYIRSKAACNLRLQQHPWASKMSFLYPTVIVGGDACHHWTPLTQSLKALPHWLRWGGRFLKAEGAFHWIYAADIAQLLAHWVKNPAKRPQSAVLGQAALSIQELLDSSCRAYGLHYQPQISLEWGLEPLLWALSSRMNPWDRYTLKQRQLCYPAVKPEDLGLDSYYSNWSDLILKYR